MAAEGVKFVTGTMVGKDMPKGVFNDSVKVLPASKLMKDFDAVVLAGGSETPRALPVPGRALDGVHYALEFLFRRTGRLAAARKTRSTRPASASW